MKYDALKEAVRTAQARRRAALPRLEEDEGGQRRVVGGNPVHQDATRVAVSPPPSSLIGGILPTAHASPPGGWARHLGLSLPEGGGGLRLNSGRSRNVEDRRGRRPGGSPVGFLGK